MNKSFDEYCLKHMDRRFDRIEKTMNRQFAIIVLVGVFIVSVMAPIVFHALKLT